MNLVYSEKGLRLFLSCCVRLEYARRLFHQSEGLPRTRLSELPCGRPCLWPEMPNPVVDSRESSSGIFVWCVPVRPERGDGIFFVYIRKIVDSVMIALYFSKSMDVSKSRFFFGL